MYTIIGGDGKEYGPVTADQVRAWIAGGRANLETKVRPLGADEWRRIADFPEFAAPGGAGAVPPVAAPLPAGARKLDIISCYERSWVLLKANFWSLVGVSLLMSVILSVLGSHTLGLIYISPLFSAVISGGWYYFFLLKIRGQRATIGDAFAGFTRAFLPLVATGLLVGIFVLVGFCLLIIPGIYLMVAYAFAYILATDKRLGIWESMETSRVVITSQWWRVLGLALLGILFLMLGVAALGVGIFVAIPFVFGAIAYAYEDLCNPR